jgi:hypothetical protein
MWVKYNRLLHGRQAKGAKRRDLLSTAFLKKYIHWCKFLKPPSLTEEASAFIAQQYAEMRREKAEAGAEKTLPVTARSLETMIRLSTAHAKLRQSKDVTLADAECALRVMKFAIYADEKRNMDKGAGTLRASPAGDRLALHCPLCLFVSCRMGRSRTRAACGGVVRWDTARTLGAHVQGVARAHVGHPQDNPKGRISSPVSPLAAARKHREPGEYPAKLVEFILS